MLRNISCFILEAIIQIITSVNQVGLVRFESVDLKGDVIAFNGSYIVNSVLFSDLNDQFGVTLLDLIELINLAVRLHSQRFLQSD